jgi:TP901 family phage tail tape measure protein
MADGGDVIGRAIVEVAASFARLDADLSKVGKRLDTAVQSMTRRAQVVLGVAMGAGAAMALRTAVGSAIDLESRFADLRKTTGLTGEALGGVQAEIKQIATTMAGANLHDLLDIGVMGGRMGVAPGDIGGFVRDVGMMKIAMDDIPAEELATKTARILNVFHLGTDSMKSFGSAMNKLDDSSTATGRDILEISSMIAGSAQTLGLSPQKVLALSAAMKDAGIHTEVAGTAMNQILGKMATETDKFAGAAGVSGAEFRKALADDPLQALTLLMDGLKRFDEFGQMEALKSLGLEGSRVRQVLLQLGQVTGQLGGYVATANREWQTQASIQAEVATRGETTQAQLQRLGNILEITASEMGEALLPVIKRLVDFMAQAGLGIRAWADDNKAGLQAFADGFLGILETITVAVRNWDLVFERTSVMISGWITNIGEVFTWLGSVIGAFLDWFGSNWRTIFQDAFNAVLTALGNLGDNFQQFGKAAYDWIASGFQKPFEMKMKPLMEGFEATTQAPELPALKLSNVDDQLAAVDEKMYRAEQERLDTAAEMKKEDATKAAAEAARPKAEAPRPEHGEEAFDRREKNVGKSQSIDEFFKQISSAALGQDKQAEMVDQQQQSNRHLAKIATEIGLKVGTAARFA